MGFRPQGQVAHQNLSLALSVCFLSPSAGLFFGLLPALSPP